MVTRIHVTTDKAERDKAERMSNAWCEWRDMIGGTFYVECAAGQEMEATLARVCFEQGEIARRWGIDLVEFQVHIALTLKGFKEMHQNLYERNGDKDDRVQKRAVHLNELL